MPGEPLRYWDRRLGRERVEQVYGDAGVRWLYGAGADAGEGSGSSGGARVGTKAAELLAGAWPSRLYGYYQSSPLSRRKIAPFIRDFGIAMEEYEPGPFRTFNDFFIRRFRPGARAFAADPAALPAFAEARYLAYERVTAEQAFPVKGAYLSPAALLGGAKAARFAKAFDGGPLLIARLCPVDYHRFHYPDSGRALEHYSIHGRLHSVNPLALRSRGEIFATNERQVSILETEHFGRLAYVEVGAMAVGLIVQTHPEGAPFGRGQEKGYFLFGASTVIVLGEPGRWAPSADLLEQSLRKRETLVRLGEEIGRARSG